MKKGFLITGVAVIICLTLVVALNYVIHSQKITDSSSLERMTIDRTNNRAVDVYRVIGEAAADAKADAGCAEIDARLTSVLSQSQTMLASEGITMTYAKSVASCTVNVNYTLDSPSLHKTTVFSKSY